MKSLGDHVRDALIKNGCLRFSQCPNCGKDQPILFVWESNTAEFIEAAIVEWKRENS
jgi:hypothetical protein